MVTVFDQLLTNESLVDVTLACEGLSLKAHKIVLSACSPFFQNLFLENPCKHPIVIMKDMKYAELKAIVDFIYKGEVNVSHYQLTGLLKTAELLNIKGLMEVANENINFEPLEKEISEQQSDDSASAVTYSVEKENAKTSSLHKKRRGKRKRRISNDSTSSDNDDIPPKLHESKNNEKILPEIPEIVNDSNSDDVSVSPTEHYQLSTKQSSNKMPRDLFFSSTQDDYTNVEEPMDDERNYDQSPDFVKQIVLTESKSLVQDCASQGPTICSVSSQGNVQDEFRNNNFINTNAHENEQLVSCSTLSETSTPNFLDDEMPDIKPIIVFDEFGNPTAKDVSHKDIVSVDDSGVLSLPGPSIYQLDTQPPEQDSHDDFSFIEQMSDQDIDDQFSQKERFYNILDNYYDGKPGKKPFTREKLQRMIKEITDAKLKTKSKSRRDYYLLGTYDVLIDNDQSHLVRKRFGNDLHVNYIVAYEDLFEKLYDCHVNTTGHGGKVKMRIALQKTLNVPRPAIDCFISTCMLCNEKKSLRTSSLYRRLFGSKRKYNSSINKI